MMVTLVAGVVVVTRIGMLPQCPPDEAAKRIAGFTARQVFKHDHTTPAWAVGSADGQDLSAYLLASEISPRSGTFPGSSRAETAVRLLRLAVCELVRPSRWSRSRHPLRPGAGEASPVPPPSRRPHLRIRRARPRRANGKPGTGSHDRAGRAPAGGPPTPLARRRFALLGSETLLGGKEPGAAGAGTLPHNPRGVSSMVEQRTFNPWVQGSSPWRPTKRSSRFTSIHVHVWV